MDLSTRVIRAHGKFFRGCVAILFASTSVLHLQAADDGKQKTSVDKVVRTFVKENSDNFKFLNDKRGAKAAMNRLRSGIEEWGLVTASVPAIFTPNHQFKLDQNASDFYTVKEYMNFQLGNVSGVSLQSNETGITNQASVSGKGSVAINPTTGLAEPTLPNAADVDASKAPLPPLNLSNSLSSPSPAAPGDLALKLTKISGIPPRSALLLGMNDKLTERILSVMADPPQSDFISDDFVVHFAIVQVSCNPGWRTRENYIADLTGTCEYYNSSAKKGVASIYDERAPQVFSVLPLLDAQNLELGNSDRSLTALAAQVSAAYPTIGLSLLGQDLITFVHRSQKDSITRTPVTVTNSYSNGRNFGFRFSPSFTAQADPAYRKSRAANILNSVSFPVLITVILKKSDFVSKDKDADDKTGKKDTALLKPASNFTAADDKEKKGPEFDTIRVNISTRWLIKDRPPLVVWYKRLYTPMLRNYETLRENTAKDVDSLQSYFYKNDQLAADAAASLAEKLKAAADREKIAVAHTDTEPEKKSIRDEAEAEAKAATDEARKSFFNTAVYQRLRQDALELITKTGPQTAYIPIEFPKETPAKPIALDVASGTTQPLMPSKYPGDKAFVLTISGTNLGAATMVALGGKAATEIKALGKNVLIATFPAGPVAQEPLPSLPGYAMQDIIPQGGDSRGDNFPPSGAQLVIAGKDVQVSTNMPSYRQDPEETKVVINIIRDEKGNVSTISMDTKPLGPVTSKDLLDALSKSLAPSSNKTNQ